MFIELHLLQNFAPSCLNRDDTNSPKDCVFGGYRRARISSQCIKQTIRKHFRIANLLPREHLAERSQRLIGEVADSLAARGRPREEGAARARAALGAVRLAADEANETEYLLFLGHNEIEGLAEVIDRHWDGLAGAPVPGGDQPDPEKDEAPGSSVTPSTAPSGGDQPDPEKDRPAPKKKTARQKKTEAREAVPAEVAGQVKAVLRGSKAADLALFGRMVADQADLNVDAACQVAHALSTNKVSMEMDFYTAVDDLKKREEDVGAGMLGTVEFNSSCFYRYTSINFGLLVKNLQEDHDLARKTVEAFFKASVGAIPTGRQNSMAAHNPPSLLFAVVQERQWSLANAFEKPVFPNYEGSLVQNSIRALDGFWGRLTKMYGTDGLKVAKVCLDAPDLSLNGLSNFKVDSVAKVIEAVLGQLADGKEGA